MVYPTLPAAADAVSIFEIGLSPYYDIVWSVTYHVEDLAPGDEIGLCMFLQDESQPLSGGGVGIDLGYSGLSADNPLYPKSVGMLGAVVGVGLDSTGQFPLSVTWPDGTLRDGLNEADRVLNSASIRGSYPNYPYLSGSNTEITEFDIADSQKKTIRARLGNYGRTIYLDYKRDDDDSFTNILTKDVDISFSETTRFRPGVSIAKPISASATSNNQVVIEAFHIEGRDEDATNTNLPFTPIIPLTGTPALTGCQPNITDLCWSIGGTSQATLTGSADDGLFSGEYDLFDTNTPVTLTWNAMVSGWFLDTNDGIYENELISTRRCDPTGTIQPLLEEFTIARGSCNYTPPSGGPEPPLPPDPDPPRPLEPFDKTCGDMLSGFGKDNITTAVYRLSGGTGPVTITYNLSSPPLSSINTSLSTTSYAFETTAGTTYGQLSVNILSAYTETFGLLQFSEGSMATFSNLNSAVSGEVLTVVGFNNYPNICTLWVDESAADGLSISASTCQEYVSAFTMILTGDYSFSGSPSGYQNSPSNNELYKVVERLEKPEPVRFDVEYDDETIYETGYVGSEEYSYGGIYRQQFINAIDAGAGIEGFTTSTSLTAGLDASQIAVDGYPLVTSALTGSTVFQKETDTTRMNVTVYDILSSRDWTFNMSCPCFELYPFSINWCTSAWVTDPAFTSETLSCPNSGYWSLNPNGLRVRYNVADSTNCDGTCNGVQHGQATASLTAIDAVDMNVEIKGAASYSILPEQISLKIDDVLVARSRPNMVESATCSVSAVSAEYVVEPPYRLQADSVTDIVVDFTTGDEYFHKDVYYEVDLSFDPVVDTDIRHWNRINCDVASQLSAVENSCIPEPGCPPITEVCVTYTIFNTGDEIDYTYRGNLEDGYVADDIPGAILEWDPIIEEWFLTDAEGQFVQGSAPGTGSKDRCNPAGTDYTNIVDWRAVVDSSGPCRCKEDFMKGLPAYWNGEFSVAGNHYRNVSQPLPSTPGSGGPPGDTWSSTETATVKFTTCGITYITLYSDKTVDIDGSATVVVNDGTLQRAVYTLDITNELQVIPLPYLKNPIQITFNPVDEFNIITVEVYEAGTPDGL